MGSMTGRGVGFCNNNTLWLRYQVRGTAAYGYQRGYRRQFYETGVPGYLRSNYSQIISDVDEKTYLANQEKMLNNQLKYVKERLADMEDHE